MYVIKVGYVFFISLGFDLGYYEISDSVWILKSCLMMYFFVNIWIRIC